MFQQITQFSVFLINKPGILSRVCGTLAESKVNLVALTLMDSVEHGVFRFVASDSDRARNVIKSLGLTMTETEVLRAEMPNRPGALADLCARLNTNHISIKYAYVTSGAAGGRTTGIFKVDNMQKALRLSSNNSWPKRKEKKVVKQNRAIRAG